MGFVDVLLLLLVACVVGCMGLAISGYTHGGLLLALVLGFLGALLGFWLARTLNFYEPLALDVGTVPFPLLWTVVGAGLLMALLGLLRGRPMD